MTKLFDASCNLYLYADDAKLFGSYTGYLQSAIAKCGYHCQLTLAPSKCEHLYIFHVNSALKNNSYVNIVNFQVDSQVLATVSKVKDLWFFYFFRFNVVISYF